MEISTYILSLKIAIVAYVYSDVLTEPGMVLNWLFLKLNKLPEWLFKPLIGCFKCVSGQMALWCFLALNFNQYSNTNPYELSLLIGNHIFFITNTILLTWIISKCTQTK